MGDSRTLKCIVLLTIKQFCIVAKHLWMLSWYLIMNDSVDQKETHCFRRLYSIKLLKDLKQS